jgi:peptide/nickel transport system permease protein
MFRFLLRRLSHAGILVFVTLTVTFFIIDLAPGDPLTRFYDPDIDPRAMESVRSQLGLDEPLPLRYVKTMASFARGDFGVSFVYRRPVANVLADVIPRTLALTVLALLLQVLIGLALGALSAWKRYSAVDKSFSSLFLVLYSIPTFYLAFMLIALFALKLQWLPSAGIESLDVSGGMMAVIADRVRHATLPVAVLALGSAAGFARYARGSLLDVANQEFVRTARAKGLTEQQIMWKHAFKNALPQIMTVIGLSLPFLLAGAVVVEKIFAWPGMGALLVDSIFARDYPVVLAINFIAACMVILGNLLADLSCAWVDPRIKVEETS